MYLRMAWPVTFPRSLSAIPTRDLQRERLSAFMMAWASLQLLSDVVWGLRGKDLGMVFVACGHDFSCVAEGAASRPRCPSERMGVAQITGSSPLSTLSIVFSSVQRYLSLLTTIDVGLTGESTFKIIL